MQYQLDAQLLLRYARQGSEAAFGEIVARHADLVYSAALRQVDSPDLARDVAQSVFIDLARKARPLAEKLPPDASLVGWLYRSTRFAALSVVRGAQRRQAKERQAMDHLATVNTTSEATLDWDRVRPLLDEAISSLGEEDRDALLLRFFKDQDFRAVGLALGVSDDAAQKRVSRALEKLRDLLGRRGITTTAAALSVAISANAVQAAPVGLVATISSIAAATAISPTAIIASKVLAMTTLQKTIIGAALVAAIGTGIHQSRRASRLTEQVNALQQQQAPLAEQIQRLLEERDDATNQLASLREDNERLNRNTGELLKLRGEVNLLRRSLGAAAGTAGTALSATEVPASQETSAIDNGRELGMAVVRGEPAALKKVLDLAKTEHESFKTNSAGLTDTLRGELGNRTFAPLRAAFDVIAEAAAKGNPLALDAVAQATQAPELNGMAMRTLGTLAGAGNNDALEILLNPEKYGFLLSSTVSALRPAAENGNQKAIEFLAAVATSADQQALWFMAAGGLTKAAESGNPLAVDTLISLSGCTNTSVQRVVVSGLKQAAANQNAKAAEALRSMGVQ